MQLSKLKDSSPQPPLSSQKKPKAFPWLLLCMVIGACLRFTLLGAKPPWTDEFATLVFSLGNSYLPVPLNEPISLAILLQLLQVNSEAGVGDVVHHLIGEDNHPPLYFILAHLWMNLFPMGQYVSVWVARAFPALLGVLSIPAIYGLAKLAFRSRTVARAAAAIMAVSPYGVFIAQEARHYTLSILFGIASLACLVAAARHLWRGTKIPLGLMGLWVVINGLGFITHYFFVLTLGSEAIALLLLLWGVWWRGRTKATPQSSKSVPQVATPQSYKRQVYASFWNNFARLSVVAVGTATIAVLWLWLVLPDDYGSTMTEWIQNDNGSFLAIISPFFQLAATIVTMLSLLPIESSHLSIVIISGALMIAFFLWALPILRWGVRVQWRNPSTHFGTRLAFTFFIGAIALFFGITYFKGIDITRGARYSFVYFPGVILLLGAILTACWQSDAIASTLSKNRLKTPRPVQINGKRVAIILWLMAFVSSISVVNNLGYRKYYRPDLLVPLIEQSSTESILIATTHRSLVQTGELAGIAWLLKDKPIAEKTKFLLAHQTHKDSTVPTGVLRETLQQMPRSLDLWVVNFHAPIELNDCVLDSQSFPHINGYDYKLYHCPEVENIRAIREFED
ncbi:glycosyltransferase family 39 protein [Lusitaniella coriacea]|uniref:glycosyltransferase family 39 protein n=1 Tax=Lusitaniella coriacea TaxID=1983105 RepID=UPI003CF105E8